MQTHTQSALAKTIANPTLTIGAEAVPGVNALYPDNSLGTENILGLQTNFQLRMNQKVRQLPRGLMGS